MDRLFRGKGAPHAPHASQDNQKHSGDEQKAATRLLPETTWADEPIAAGIPPQDTVVVTISRQFGSRGSEIGQLVADRAGLSYVDQQLIAEVAQRLGVEVQSVAQRDEQTAGVIGYLLEAIQASNPLNTGYYTLRSSTSALAHANELTYLQLTQRVILE